MEILSGKKVKMALTTEQAMFYYFFNRGAGWGWVVNATPLPLYPGERHPLPIL
jgi:hypothetical protein